MKSYNLESILIPSNINVSEELFDLKDSKLLGYLPKVFASIKNNCLTSVEQDESDFIVKFAVDGLESYSSNEHFFLWLANESGVKCSENALKVHDTDYLFISKRFDEGKQLIHLADMFSKGERRNISIESTLKLVNDFDLTEEKNKEMQEDLFKQFLFSNTIGNFDLHAYNMAFLYENGELELAPAYDIVCTQIFDESTRSAIKVKGKSSDVNADDIFNVFYEYSSLDKEKILCLGQSIAAGIKNNLIEIRNSLIDKEDIEFAYNYIQQRTESLSNYLNSAIVSGFVNEVETERTVTVNI